MPLGGTHGPTRKGFCRLPEARIAKTVQIETLSAGLFQRFWMHVDSEEPGHLGANPCSATY